MDQSVLVTIAVPVYNAEKYLNRCIGSLVGQSYRNIEIILIDDGSTDNSSQICDAWTQKDDRIRVIHKENAGAGMARNTAIEAARGEYICFVDSDDYIDLLTIESALVEANKNSADMVMYGLSDVDSTGCIIASHYPNPGECMYCGKDVQEIFLPYLIYPSAMASLCCVLLSMRMIRTAKWTIPSERDVYSEDYYALIDLCGYVEKVVLIQKPLYFYCNNGASLSHSSRLGEYGRIRDFYLKIRALCVMRGYSAEAERRCIYPYFGFTIAALKYYIALGQGRGKTRDKVREVVEDNTLQEALAVIRKDKMSLKRKVLLWTIQNRYINMCCFLLALQNLRKA